MRLPKGQLKASANSFMLDNEPITLKSHHQFNYKSHHNLEKEQNGIYWYMYTYTKLILISPQFCKKSTMVFTGMHILSLYYNPMVICPLKVGSVHIKIQMGRDKPNRKKQNWTDHNNITLYLAVPSKPYGRTTIIHGPIMLQILWLH